MIYIVDIDDTICETVNKNYYNSKPYRHRIEKINQLYEEGHTIIYWTARGTSSGSNWFHLTYQQLQSWGCKFNELRMGKPSYDVWIDDKAISDTDFFRITETNNVEK